MMLIAMLLELAKYIIKFMFKLFLIFVGLVSTGLSCFTGSVVIMSIVKNVPTDHPFNTLVGCILLFVFGILSFIFGITV